MLARDQPDAVGALITLVHTPPRLRLDQVRSSQVKSSQVKSSQVKSSQIKLACPTSLVHPLNHLASLTYLLTHLLTYLPSLARPSARVAPRTSDAPAPSADRRPQQARPGTYLK